MLFRRREKRGQYYEKGSWPCLRASIFDRDTELLSSARYYSDNLNGRYFNLKYPLTEKIRDTRCKFDYKANPALEKFFIHSDNGEFNTEKMQAFVLKHV